MLDDLFREKPSLIAWQQYREVAVFLSTHLLFPSLGGFAGELSSVIWRVVLEVFRVRHAVSHFRASHQAAKEVYRDALNTIHYRMIHMHRVVYGGAEVVMCRHMLLQSKRKLKD